MPEQLGAPSIRNFIADGWDTTNLRDFGNHRPGVSITLPQAILLWTEPYMEQEPG
jgi:hypothetical protein